MKNVLLTVVVVVAVAISASPVVAAEDGSHTTAQDAVDGARHPALLDPTLAAEKAPDAYRVRLETTKGDVIILVNRSWAPNGADRFYNLVRIGYFDGVAFYRAVKGFMVQCGFHGDPKITAAWSRAAIKDDPVTQSNARGMVTFAHPGRPNSRTTQFFINTVDNDYLARYEGFSPFGKVISGMDVVDALYTGYGEGAPQGNGPSQARIAREGNEYLKKEFPKLDYIVTATIVDAE